MYGIIMAEIVDSSLMAEGGKNACWAFSMMCAHADKDHCLRKDPRMFAKSIDMTVDEFNKALVILEKPDPYSNITDYEGRRIIPLSDINNIDGNRGWFIVNREHYTNSIKSGSKDRVIKHRKKEKILKLINELKERNVTVTLQPISLSIYISISISLDVINYLIEKKIDLDHWAEYEQYRKTKINKPLKTDQGRKAQANKLIGLNKSQQKTVIQNTIDNEWIKLIQPKTTCLENSNSIPLPKYQKRLEAWASERGIKASSGETYDDLYKKCLEYERKTEN